MKRHHTLLALSLYILTLTSVLFAQPGTSSPIPVGGANVQVAADNRALRARPMPIKIHRGMKRGDVLARGNKVDADRDGFIAANECQFDFGVEITLMSGSRTVNVGRGPDCTAVLDSVIDVDVVEADVAEGQVAGARSPGLIASTFRLFGRLWDVMYPTLSAQLYLVKGVYGHVYTWGGGGPYLDGLTAQQGWLEWKYDLNEAIMRQASGWYCPAGPYPGCQPPLTIPPMFPTNLGWAATAQGFGDVFRGPGTVVTRLDFSSWKFLGDTFKHTLYERRNGYRHGAGTCSGWINGSYPVSWTTHCNTYFPG